MPKHRDDESKEMDILQDEAYVGFEADNSLFKKYFSHSNNSDSIKALRANFVSSPGSGSVKGGLGSSYVFAKKNSVDLTSFLCRTQISLQKVLQCRPVLLMFYNFLKLRLCTEGLLFWIDVECFQNTDWKPIRLLGLGEEKEEKGQEKVSDINQEAMRIFSTYLSKNAKNEICVSDKIMEDTVKKLSSKNLTRNVFRDAQRQIFRDLEKGIFQEFLSCLSQEGIDAVEENLKEMANSPAMGTVNAIKYRRNSTGVFEK